MKSLVLVAAALTTTLLAGQPAFAQGLILQPEALNKSILLEELMPRPPGVKTRSLKIRPTGASGQSKEGSASILITFHTNSAELTEQAKASLDIVAGALNDQQLAPYSFRIEGHADPRGEDQYNLLLSQARAERVVDYLVHQHGMSTARLRAIGLGETQVLRPDQPSNPENRRVTIVRN